VWDGGIQGDVVLPVYQVSRYSRNMSDKTTTPHSVFVVDDEVVIANTLSIILKQAGFDALPFSSPVEALKSMDSERPELLISDVMMPGMTGIELAIEFQILNPKGKVILFSGQSATADLLEESRKKGHDFEILAKPLHPADLLAKLRG
jgi:DNA-binding NtrC family response regulator